MVELGRHRRISAFGAVLASVAVTLLALAGPASAAQSVTLTGSITPTDPTFTAPVPVADDTPDSVEPVGGQHYDAYRFRITVTHNTGESDPQDEAAVEVGLHTTGTPGRLCTYDDTFDASDSLDGVIFCGDSEIVAAGPDHFTQQELFGAVPSADCLTVVVSTTPETGTFDYSLAVEPPSGQIPTYVIEPLSLTEPCEAAATTTTSSSTSSTTSSTVAAAASSTTSTTLHRGLPVSGSNTRTTGLIAVALLGLGLVVTGRSIELRLRSQR